MRPSGLAPLASVPSTGMPLTSVMLPAVTAARPLAPRAAVALPAHDQHPAVHAANVTKKRPDRPPHLANLEQALIEKLHGPRKPAPPVVPVQAMHSPAAHSLPGTMAWFPMPYGQHIQPTHTLAAVQSPVVSPPFSTDLQPTCSTFNLAADMATSGGASATLPSMSLAATSVYSGRTTPCVATAAESVPTAGMSVTAVTLHSGCKLTDESVEAVHVTASASEKLIVASTSSAEHLPSKRKLQFTVSAVKDDPLAVNSPQESTSVCEASIVSSESALQNPALNLTSTQNYAPVTPGLQEPAPSSTCKAPVKKGRFRISDVKEDTDTGVSNSQLEGSSQPQEASLSSGTRTDPATNSVATAVQTAPEPSAQQVCYKMLLSISSTAY